MRVSPYFGYNSLYQKHEDCSISFSATVCTYEVPFFPYLPSLSKVCFHTPFLKSTVLYEPITLPFHGKKIRTSKPPSICIHGQTQQYMAKEKQHISFCHV